MSDTIAPRLDPELARYREWFGLARYRRPDLYGRLIDE